MHFHFQVSAGKEGKEWKDTKREEAQEKKVLPMRTEHMGGVVEGGGV